MCSRYLYSIIKEGDNIFVYSFHRILVLKHNVMDYLSAYPSPAQHALAQVALIYRYGEEHQPITEE